MCDKIKISCGECLHTNTNTIYSVSMVDAAGSKKRKAAPSEEIEIDLDAPEPTSKRAARRLKKGKTLAHAPSAHRPMMQSDESDEDEESEAENSSDAASNTSVDATSKESKKSKKSTKDKKDKVKKAPREGADAPDYKKGTNGIWIGNLSFKTTEEDLKTFFTTLKPLGKDKSPTAYASITAKDIVRISLPQGTARGQNKGFAYVDFATPEQQETAVALSERILQSRNVLIKKADSFAGRPEKPSASEASDEKATKILYVGNLSFDITGEELTSYLGGEAAGIKKMRMATFEDSGKCKGFAFVDFKSVDEVKRVLANKKLRSMNGRKLKMEFGEDRSQRRKTFVKNDDKEPVSKAPGRIDEAVKRDPRTITPGLALTNAQRASTAISASTGQKTTFD
jgi:RNA recognition motif-containing protein